MYHCSCACILLKFSSGQTDSSTYQLRQLCQNRSKERNVDLAAQQLTILRLGGRTDLTTEGNHRREN